MYSRQNKNEQHPKRSLGQEKSLNCVLPDRREARKKWHEINCYLSQSPHRTQIRRAIESERNIFSTRKKGDKIEICLSSTLRLAFHFAVANFLCVAAEFLTIERDRFVVQIELRL